MTPRAPAGTLGPAASNPARKPRLRAAAAPAALALAAGLATALLLPGHAFVATSVVGVEGGPPTLRPALIQAAADAAVSRQVMSRAGAALNAPARLLSAIRVETGRVGGTLLVRASDADAERAAAMASAVATALVADLEDKAQDTRRANDAAAALRLARMQDAAVAAHRRLTELGGDAADPAAARAAAPARVEALRVRLDAIRAILAAGNPPLGAGRDVPPNIEALQTSYLDLSRQLAKARETLGERHTTVIGLQDGMKRTAADLVQAWTRLAKATEADLADAKARAATAARGGAGDASRAAAIATARAAAQSADEAVAQLQATPGTDDARWRVVARAPVPAFAEGFALPIRIVAGLAAALLVAALAGLSRRRRRDEPAILEPTILAATMTEPATTELSAIDGMAGHPEPQEPRFFEDAPDLAPEPVAAAPTRPSLGHALATASLRGSSAPSDAPVEHDVARDTLPEESPMDTRYAVPRRDGDVDLVATMTEVLSGVDAIVPRDEVPVVLVATNEPGAGTMESVIALGEAAAAAGRRVLVVEGGCARPALAGAVAEAAQPALVRVFGAWRIVLRAETGGGLLYLAPSFRNGARLAEDLARLPDTLVADALADEFDLVLIDGDRATEAAGLARHADAILRIGRFASARDDERFLSTLGAPRAAFLGTVAAAVGVFVPRAAEASRLPEPQRPFAAARPAMHAPIAVTRHPAMPSPRRRVGSR